MKFKTFLFLAFLLSNQCLKAQGFGQHDPSIDWQTIDTEQVRVVFPSGTALQAQRIADIIYYLHARKKESIGMCSKKIDVILQTQQVVSNGFVTLAPYRSELFGTAPPNFKYLGSTEWLDLLTIHEYRHALQYANSNRGFTRLMYWIGGENGWASALFSSIPDWYLEGDAVLAETLYTQNGRGRNPYFFQELRAVLLEGKKQDYHKARNGSFKDLVPNKYALGYTIARHMRNTYGIATGKKVLADAGSYKYVIRPFSRALKKHTGLRSPKMYLEAYEKLQKKWSEEAAMLQLSPATKISNPRNKEVTHYTFPQFLKDGSIVCLKSSYRETTQLIRIENQKEELLLNVGIAVQPYLSAKNNKLAWTAYQKHPRWANKNYSNVIAFDLETGIKKQLTSHEKLFSPEFSNDGTRLVAVSVDEKLQNHLVLLNATSGKITDTLPNPTNDFLSYPKWGPKDKFLFYLAKRNGKIAFFKWDFKSRSARQLSDWTAHTIGSFSVSEKALFFSASLSGIDNIYALMRNGRREIRQMTSVKIGASTPTFNEKEASLVYSAFHVRGHALEKTNIDLKSATNIQITAPNKQERYALQPTKMESPFLDSVPQNEHRIKAYKGFFKGLKLHSWGLFLGNNNQPEEGLQLQASNSLQNTAVQFQLVRNNNENSLEYAGSLHYSKKYTELHVRGSRQQRNSTSINGNRPLSESFSETIYGIGLAVPLSWIRGNYKTTLSASTSYAQHETSNYTVFDLLDKNVTNTDKSLSFGAVESQLTYANFRRTALQNLAPKWGYFLNIRHAVSTNENPVESFLSIASVYFPGISKNHSSNLEGMWKKQGLFGEYRFPDLFAYARGYYGYTNEEATKMSFNYQFPLWYPDWGFRGIVYVKRIRANLFVDRSQLKGYTTKTTQNSFGSELIFDTNFFNNLPISLGFRSSFLQNTDASANTKATVFDVFYRLNL